MPDMSRVECKLYDSEYVYTVHGQYTAASLRARWLRGQTFSQNLVRAVYKTSTRCVLAAKFLLHARYTLQNFTPKFTRRGIFGSTESLI